MDDKLALYGFNNLTKSLCFNFYDVFYAKTVREQKDYLEYIDEQYNSDRLTAILCQLTEMIGAHILNISKQDYEPQGASVNILIAEQEVPRELVDESNNLGAYVTPPDYLKGAELVGFKKALEGRRDTVHAHLDKSHVTVHTFPESHPNKAISTFRVDIDVSTCGTVSPLSTLDFLISSFDADIMTVDYRVRGFTRDTNGKKFFLDHRIRSIQDYLSDRTLRQYDAMDVNVYQANIFHTRLMIKEIKLQNYLFNQDVYELSPRKRLQIHDALQREMIEIYSAMNVYD